MKNYKLGLCSVSFRQNSPEEILKHCVDSGLDCVEWGSDVHAPACDDAAIEKIASLQREYGITCSSYGTYFYLVRDSLDDLPSYINAAKKLGTNILRLWCGEKGSKDISPDEKAELFEICKKAAALAESMDAVLCMEFHSGTFVDNADSAIELIEEINSPHFRVYWQPDVRGDKAPNIESALKLRAYTQNIHVHYWVDLKQHSLTEGVDKWREYASVFPDGKTFLIEFIPGGKIENLSVEADALREIVK